MANEKKPFFATRSGILVDETYTQASVKNYNPEEKPGEYPFTRGTQKDMYRGRLWTMRQYAGFGSAEASNARYHYLLKQGTTGLSVAFDLPTQLGLDPDHARAKGEVGKVGVSISNLEDMRILFKDIDLAQVSTSMTINATAAILFAFYTIVAEENGAPLGELRGTVQNDILKEYIARGNYIFPVAGALRLTTDMFSWAAQNTPKWNPISISGYHIREAGSTAVQELAFTFANAITYVEAAIKSGQSIDSFAKQLSFFFNVHSDFFEEIAKFRAARRIWAKIMRERFGAKDERSLHLRFHAQTAGSTLTAQQPHNNVMRVTLQALSSVLGGTQSLHTNSMDEALSLPSPAAAELALRTQQVIAYETLVTNTVDPLAGSFFIESLTDQLEVATFSYLQQIEAQGGMIAAIETGWVQNEILNSAYSDQRAIDEKKIKVVGVNCFAEKSENAKIVAAKIDETLAQLSIDRVRAYRQKRNPKILDQRLVALADGAKKNENLQGLIREAAKAGATLGEISDVLRKCFGLQREYAGF